MSDTLPPPVPASVPVKFCGGEQQHGPHDWGSDQDYFCHGNAG
jgi:hypothetical protein